MPPTTPPATTRRPIAVTYWTFRLMIGLGLLAALLAGWLLWATRRERVPQRTNCSWPRPWPFRFLPLLANSFGWIFTEMGRQPWAVFGLMTTEHGVSPGGEHRRGR